MWGEKISGDSYWEVKITEKRRKWAERSSVIFNRKLLLTLRETLVRQRHLTREQVEAEAVEDAAERWGGDETVGGTRLEGRETEHQIFFSLSPLKPSVGDASLSHPDEGCRFSGVIASHHPAGFHRQLIHRL